MKKKIISILIMIILLLYFYSSFIVNATSLSEQKEDVEDQEQEAQEQLEYVQDELSETLTKIQELDDNIREAQSEIDSMEEQLTDLQSKVEEKTEEYNKLQETYDENEQLLEDRLVAMYESGDTTYLDVLLNSSSLTDFISNYYLINQIVESDTDLLNSIEDEKQSVEEVKNELEEEKSNLKMLKAKKEQTYISMQNKKTIQQNYINQLSDEEKELEEQIEEFKDEEERIQNLIDLAASQEYQGEYTGGVMAWPVAKSGTYITSGYGVREHPIYGVIKMHTGIDIGNAGYGAPVIAAADGVVSMAGYYGGYGNCVMINHGNGISTLYGHGQKILTTVGTVVKQGDLIMEVGSTGNSTGPHLHFEVRVNGTAVDPVPYLQSQ